MGKRSKQGASLRAKRRIDETYANFEQTLTEQAEQDRIQSTKDEDLFTLDTHRNDSVRSKSARRAIRREKILNNEGKKKKKYEPSDRELRQVQKVLQRHGEAGVVALATRSKARLEQRRQVRRLAGMTPKSVRPSYDIWDKTAAFHGKKKTKFMAVPTGNIALGGTAPVEIVPIVVPLPIQESEPDSVALTQPAPISKKLLKARKHSQLIAQPTLSLEVAYPGQSYHPDKEQHQDVIGEALSIEIRRKEAEEYKDTPINSGLSAFTKEYIIGESESEEEFSEEEDDNDQHQKNNDDNTKLIKKKEKLTRAQRNKQKRIKAEKISLLQRKQTKQFMHQLNEVGKHTKAINSIEKTQSARLKELKQLKEQKKLQPLGKNLWNTVSLRDPLNAPALPVALTEELVGETSSGTSLRTVIPKGSLITDRVESMTARNMICRKKLEGRRIVQGKRRRKVMGEKGTEYLLI